MSEKYPVKRAYAVGKLYKFLKEKGVYKQYASNCKIQGKTKGHKTYDDFMKELYFYHTPEGHRFWHDLANEFLTKELNEQT